MKENVRNTSQSICIKPADAYSETRIRAISIVNAFREMGFKTWGAFYETVKDHYEEAVTVPVFKRLQAFWLLRNFDEEMIEKMESIIETLKSS